MIRPDFNQKFDLFNRKFFDGRIMKIPVILNDRLQTHVGRFWGDEYPDGETIPNRIELHSRLFDKLGWGYQRDGWSLPEADLTLLHEMSHAFFYQHHHDATHGLRFQKKMTEITGMDVDHTYHSLDVSAWRRKKSVKINPFK